jgi:hypothetical protein
MTALERNDSCTLAAGTVVTSDYLPWARVLAGSFMRRHPGARFVVAVLDEPDPALLRADDAFELLRPADIGLGGAEFGWMATIYDGFELSCAVKPWLLRTLLSGADAALYLDADILVLDDLAAVAEQAAAAGLVLSPHTLEPLPDDGLFPNDDTFLRAGQFNAGFIAVGRSGGAFLDWWAARLSRDCIVERRPEGMRFVDQRWLDLARNYFDAAVLRDPGANVAYWNLGTRELELDAAGGAYRVGGVPVRFMHFSGFDPAHPDVLSKHQGTPARVDPRRSPALQQLCRRYAALLAGAGLSVQTGGRAPFSELPGPIRLTPVVRAALRRALIDAERAGEAPALDPLDPGAAAALRAWLTEASGAGRASRYLRALHASQPGMAAAFAQVPGADEERLATWALTDGVRLGVVPAPFAPSRAPVRLDGVRSFVVLVRAEEIARDATILRGLGTVFGAGDDLTLVIWAPGLEPDELVGLLAAQGLDGPGAPDMLGVVEDVPAEGFSGQVHALLTAEPVDPALALVPVATDAGTLRALVDAAGGGHAATLAA